MADVFLSYSSKDRDRIKPVVEILKQQGWSVWWDYEIRVGKQFDDVIEEELKKAKCVIVLWSENSISSKWIRTEAAEGENRKILAPVLIDDVDIPLAFKRTETAQLHGWEQGDVTHPELKILLTSVREIIERKPIQIEQPISAGQRSRKDRKTTGSSDLERYFNSLIERYQTRYESKLDGRFEITLEVSENWVGHTPKAIAETYSKDASVGKAFEYINESFKKHRRLLIVGNPGVGKTVLLLKLALNLLGESGPGNQDPFPVIFNCASWSEKFERFEDWLIEMFNISEGLSKEFAGQLLKNERIIFLIDGFDELARNEDEQIAKEIRAKFLESLNNYLDRKKQLVICSRIDEASMIQGRFPVAAKIKILDLGESQVKEALREALNDKTSNVSATNLLRIAKENRDLLKVLRTPFYFTIAVEVLDKQIVDEKGFPKEEKEIKDYLQNAFIDKKLTVAPNPNGFNSLKTRKWLQWLGKLMEKKQIVTFELADLQPTDLAKKWQFRWVAGLFSSLVAGLVFSLAGGFPGLIVIGMVIGMVTGLIVGSTKTINMGGVAQFDPSKLFSWVYWQKNLSFGFFSGLGFGLFFTLLHTLIPHLLNYPILLSVDSLVFGSVFGLVFGSVFGLVKGFNGLRRIKGFSYLETPYQRIIGGFINLGAVVFNIVITVFLLSFFVFLISSLFGSEFWVIDSESTKIVAVDTTYRGDVYVTEKTSAKTLIGVTAIIYGFVSVSMFAIFSTPLFKHLLLRLSLYIERAMPLKYATFLNYASEARILEKDGGQWRFRHQNLQDHFANRGAQ
jgi:energy-coupling factor transporter ATP-binding protein EcfA2